MIGILVISTFCKKHPYSEPRARDSRHDMRPLPTDVLFYTSQTNSDSAATRSWCPSRSKVRPRTVACAHSEYFFEIASLAA
jgi:hypothetical protein